MNNIKNKKIIITSIVITTTMMTMSNKICKKMNKCL